MENPKLNQEFIKSTSLDELNEDQIKRSVFVSNISDSTSEKEVNDFFSFCGALERIVQSKDPSVRGKQFAVVIFEEEAAASTALLLSNAVLGDSPIAVQPYGNSVPTPAPTTTHSSSPSSPSASSSSSSSSTSNVKSATAVVASLAAAGYLTGEGVLSEMKRKATEYDGKLNLTQKARYAFEVSARTCRDIDSDFQISATLSYLKDQTLAGAKTIDETYHLSEYANQAATVATEYASKALENETVKASMGWLSQQYSAASSALWSTWQDIETQTRNEIEREHGQRGGDGGDGGDGGVRGDETGEVGNENENENENEGEDVIDQDEDQPEENESKTESQKQQENDN